MAQQIGRRATHRDISHFPPEFTKLLSGLDEAWRQLAQCFIERVPLGVFIGEQGHWDTVRKAKEVCRRCEVREECLLDGIKEKEGVWGGTSVDDRKFVRDYVGKGGTIEEALMYVDAADRAREGRVE